ncbi:MAG: response regulator [Thiolinea sp.]
MNSIDNTLIKLMIVDDDLDLRDSLEAYFSQPGFMVNTFASGMALLSALTEQFNGVVVCDLKMPEMGGIEVLEALQKTSNAPPLILMTAYGDIPTAVTAMSLGAYDFLEKPFDPEQLKAKVQRAAVIRHHQVRNSALLDEKKKLREYVENFEKSLLEQALQECNGHIGKVCELLNIPRRTLNEKLLKHNLERQQFLL